MNSKKVSIIIPTYNRFELLQKCMDSLFKQTYSDIEIIVVNNGSKDGTSEYLKKLEIENKIKLIEFQENTGSPYACYNAGRHLVSGKYMSFMYDDDMLVENAIETIMDKLINSEYKWVCCNCINPRTGKFTFEGMEADCEITFEDMISGKYKGEAWSLFETKLLDGKFFREDLFGGESLVWLSIYKEEKAFYIHKALRLYVKHDNNYTSVDNFFNNALKILKNHEVYFSKFGEDYKKYNIHKEKLAKILFLKTYTGNYNMKDVVSIFKIISLKTLPYILLSFLNIISSNLTKFLLKLFKH